MHHSPEKWAIPASLAYDSGMSAAAGTETDVLVVGAGPTGLVLALWLTRLGVRVRIIDKTSEPGTTSRALAVQARTLEFYNQVGLAQAVVDGGRRVTAVNLWVKGKRTAHAVFGELGKGISPFPFALIFPQDEHERLLIDRLAQAGVHVERETELVSFEFANDHVAARLKRANGVEERCAAAYLAGCDGAHSRVREGLSIGFPGGTYTHLFYVADVEGSGPAMNGDIHVSLERADFLAVFPLKGEGRVRLVGTVRDEAATHGDKLTWNDVSKGVIESMRINVQGVNWFSTYRVHHRVADRFRRCRAFLLGDAAHVHSPVGGQGMNTGIGDAVNLSWKLAAVLRDRADASLLDTYEPERIAFARRLVATTDQGFTAVTSPSLIARLIRLNLVPLALPILFKLNVARKYLFRTVSQTLVNYRGSALSEGCAGAVCGGDRLPWVTEPPAVAGSDFVVGSSFGATKLRSYGAAAEPNNFAPLSSLDWQVHVYGRAKSTIQELCAQRSLPLHIFPWRPEMDHTGLERDAVYLIRPDGYVALADPAGDPATVTSYLEARKLLC